MSVRLYVAGSSNEIPLIQGFLKAVQDYGYEITYDWTRDKFWSYPNPSNEDLTGCAQVDEDAVRSADILWYVTPAEESGKSEGSSFELGVARGLGKIILVSGSLAGYRIFSRLATFRFALHAEALENLRTRAWDTLEMELLRALAQSDSVTIPSTHLGMKRAADALAAENKVNVVKSFNGSSYVVTRKRSTTPP